MRDDENCAKMSLPPWRFYEIVENAAAILLEADFLGEDFDCRAMIKSRGIRIKPYSAFRPENLAEMRQICNTNFWQEGMFLSAPDRQTGKPCRMIVYNDGYGEEASIVIILHEFGHYVLKHTQQSPIGELEATCFATAMITLLLLPKALQLAAAGGKASGREELTALLKQSFTKKEAKDVTEKHKKSSL